MLDRFRSKSGPVVASTGSESSDVDATRQRKFSAVEGADGGVVQLGDLNMDDQELAQFGYKPVYSTHLLQFLLFSLVR